MIDLAKKLLKFVFCWLEFAGNLSVEDAWSISELETDYKEDLRVPFQPVEAL